MDFNMILGHNLSFDEIARLESSNELWDSLKLFLKEELKYEPVNYYIKWTKEPNQENLVKFWRKLKPMDVKMKPLN